MGLGHWRGVRIFSLRAEGGKVRASDGKRGAGKVYLTRKSRFCAAHRYYDHRRSPEENEVLFGKCVNLHGHNYTLEVTIVGDVDPDTGMVLDMSELDRLTKAEVIDILDHKNLCEDVKLLSDTIPTTEAIARFIWQRLEGKVPGGALFKVRLFEDEDLYVDYYGSRGGSELL